MLGLELKIQHKYGYGAADVHASPATVSFGTRSASDRLIRNPERQRRAHSEPGAPATGSFGTRSASDGHNRILQSTKQAIYFSSSCTAAERKGRSSFEGAALAATQLTAGSAADSLIERSFNHKGNKGLRKEH
ncbi:MAG: hypothetical protein DWQ47_01085 [Acidobacteria bacterium]|nr:MAG: hypothetical protein DWQ32_11545 [Acidobacteriota bacterium]REK04096.1 MAG: hypothetical protein DWQ38_01070 [Acidobacteriota bacterium]REK15258.1 MAG: hypothetical protein DWQ43_17235 [Acidobacteriota bacterium]REK46348.1 MAG: hypothetical protein DWQ47_01085 [Acidobacteriota bacterium]